MGVGCISECIHAWALGGGSVDCVCVIFCMSLDGSGVVGDVVGRAGIDDGCKLEEHLLGG